MVIITIPKTEANVNDFQNSFNNLLIINNLFAAFLFIMTTRFAEQKFFSYSSVVKCIYFTRFIIPAYDSGLQTAPKNRSKKSIYIKGIANY